MSGLDALALACSIVGGIAFGCAIAMAFRAVESGKPAYSDESEDRIIGAFVLCVLVLAAIPSAIPATP